MKATTRWETHSLADVQWKDAPLGPDGINHEADLTAYAVGFWSV